jgi:DNA-binding transcriptional LysR family regulator
MELRHLRYFVAVAEEGSLTVAAERRLHTAQPSLSRQIRDLEYKVGVQLMTRNVRGIELTAAGRAFLDHARLALAQVDAARSGAGAVVCAQFSTLVRDFPATRGRRPDDWPRSGISRSQRLSHSRVVSV